MSKNFYFPFCECLPENFGSLKAVLVVVGVLDYHGSFRKLDKTEKALENFNLSSDGIHMEYEVV